MALVQRSNVTRCCRSADESRTLQLSRWFIDVIRLGWKFHSAAAWNAEAFRLFPLRFCRRLRKKEEKSPSNCFYLRSSARKIRKRLGGAAERFAFAMFKRKSVTYCMSDKREYVNEFLSLSGYHKFKLYAWYGCVMFHRNIYRAVFAILGTEMHFRVR